VGFVDMRVDEALRPAPSSHETKPRCPSWAASTPFDAATPGIERLAHRSELRL
jgi:hypothetical protein